MKTVRFSDVLKQAGEPELHLLLIEPGKDKGLQRAVREHRVMTLHQFQGGKSDYGAIGFEKDVRGQVLVFPKSLKQFDGKKVVAIKYELLKEASIPEPRRGAQEQPPAAKIDKRKREKKKSDQPETGKVMEFPTATAPEEKVDHTERVDDEEKVDGIDEVRTLVRRAADALRKGKNEIALDLLDRILRS
jgi:hypothetical protein